MHAELRAVSSCMVGPQLEPPKPKCTWAEALPGAMIGSTRAYMRGARPTMNWFIRAGIGAPGAAGVQTAGPRL